MDAKRLVATASWVFDASNPARAAAVIDVKSVSGTVAAAVYRPEDDTIRVEVQIYEPLSVDVCAQMAMNLRAKLGQIGQEQITSTANIGAGP